MLRKVKTAGHWLFENGYPALFWSGLTVGINLLLFEHFFEEHSCEKTKHYRSDIAKNIFWAVFITRLILLPLLAKGLKYILPPEKLPKRATVNRLEVEFNDGIETALFVFETVRDLNIYIWVAYLISFPAIWPIICSIYKFSHPSFTRGPMQDYMHFRSLNKRRLFIFFEGLYNLLSLASAASFLFTLLFNLFYNTTHPDPYPHQKTILLSLIAISSLMGGFSIAGKSTYRVMHYSEASINSLYYFLSMVTSSAACLDPDAFTDTGFVEKGWKYVLVFGLLSPVVAFIGGFHGTENVYVKHKNHRENKKDGVQLRKIFSHFLWSGKEKPPIIGLSNPNGVKPFAMQW